MKPLHKNKLFQHLRKKREPKQLVKANKLPVWRLEKGEFKEGTRYLLQKLFTDASKPYYLTQRIFTFQSKARKALEQALATGRLESTSKH